MFLGQATIDLSNNPLGIILTVGIILGVLFIVFTGNQRTKKQRAAVMSRAEELGWSYSGEEDWQHASAARFKIIYSFTGTTSGVPWAMIYSKKVRDVLDLAPDQNAAGVRRESYNQKQRSDRLDWRSDAVSIPNMVFLKYKMPAFVNQLISMMQVDANTFVHQMLSLGLTEEDNQRLIHMPFVVSLLTRTKPFETADYGLRPISSFEHPLFEAYSVSDDAASEVLNSQVLAALDFWQQSLEARYGSNSSMHYLYQPIILFYEGGVFLNFESEQKTSEDYEAIVELGTMLVKSQQ